MLTAHDKFNDILAEAQKGDSIFKAGNVDVYKRQHCIKMAIILNLHAVPLSK